MAHRRLREDDAGLRALAFPHPLLEEAALLGAVSERTVRVWLRAPGRDAVEVRLEAEGEPPARALAHPAAERDWTAAVDVALPAPAPERPFRVSAGGDRLRGRLAPRPDAPRAFAFGFGSCHLPYVERRGGRRVELAPVARLYAAFADELAREEARFALLLGDQVYADGVDALSVERALAVPKERADPAAWLAAYRAVTRGYLGEPAFLALRRSLPTLLLWDDHEIENEWGVHPARDAADRVRFDAACRAYAEYQHAPNPGAGLGPPPYGWRFRYGDCAFAALDGRGVRDHAAGRAIGAEQIASLRAWLAGEGGGAATLFVALAVPVAHAARWFVRGLEWLPPGLAGAVRDRWSSRAFTPERDALLALLFDWQASVPARQVFLLSGDVHSASAFTLRRRGAPGVVHQLTSSALSSPIDPFARAMSRLAACAPSAFEPALAIERRSPLVFAPNLGLVRVAPRPAGGHRVHFQVCAGGQLPLAAPISLAFEPETPR